MYTVGIDQLISQSARDTMTNDGVMGKDEFLKMLTMQLKHQDPLNPMSNDQFAAQLAQFSQLEALNNINENIQTEILMSQSMNNSFMINMIGKEVTSYGNQLNLTEDGAVMNFYLYGDSQDIKVRIYDEGGREVATLSGNPMRAGDRSINWDGMSRESGRVMNGTYTFVVEATNSSGTAIPADTMNNGLVSGVTYEGGMPYLVVNGSYVNLGDIITVNQPKEK